MEAINEIHQYAKLLEIIGTKIVNASENLEASETIKERASYDELNEQMQKLKDALTDYVESRSMLHSIKSPEVITGEHQKLIEAYDEFVAGTQMLIDSIDLDSSAIDLISYKGGLLKQKMGEKRTVDVVNQIIKKLST